MHTVPENWDNLIARYYFFTILSRPLAVLATCDLASLTPQSEQGRAAIDAARKWLVEQQSEQTLTRFVQAALPYPMASRRRPDAAGDLAAACAVGVATAQRDSALAAAIACGAVALCDEATGGFARQRKIVGDIVHIAENPTVRQLLIAAEVDPSARPLFWDAMHDAGYAPVIPRM